MSGMVADARESPNPLGMKFGSRRFREERMPKEEEKRVTVLYHRSGSRFKSEGAGQLRVSPMMGRQPTPLRHESRPHKDWATTTVAVGDRGAEADWT
jgi:hypothetical protein